MFQSFKKWVKNEEVAQRPSPPSGMQLMHGDLQRKFAKGVQYNMKIVIRGDRNTGKTCLWHRLKGKGFVEEYIPTAEIQVSSIHWDYKATDDVVKVDVWDVVDQGKSKKKESKGLKISETPTNAELEEQVLDAAFLDVYKHTHAVILIFDITKKWTFSYIERELPKVPNHIPALVLANFRDMGDHRTVNLDEVESLIESINRPHGSASILMYESSMKNGFGLKYIHNFFNMPFLLVQRESLLKQLETNHLDLESCLDELATEDYSYEEFLERKNGVTAKKSPAAPINAAVASKSKNKSPAANLPTPLSISTNTTVTQKPDDISDTNQMTIQPTLQPTTSVQITPSPSPQSQDKEPKTPPVSQTGKKSFMEKLFKRTPSDPSPKVPPEVPNKLEIVTDQRSNKVANVDDFVPDEGNTEDFLNELHDEKEKVAYDDSSDDDEDGGNPMVTGFQEDLDSDDDFEPAYRETVSLSSGSEPELL